MRYNEIIFLGMSSIARVSYCVKLAIARNVSIKVIETIHKATGFIMLAYIPFSIVLMYLNHSLSSSPVDNSLLV